MAATTEPKEAKLTQLMSKDLTDLPGKEGLMLMIEYPPGSSDPIHRHNAHGFIYVLEGSIVMQVRGGKEVTLTPGQTFYEGPEDVHVVGRNARAGQSIHTLGFPLALSHIVTRFEFHRSFDGVAGLLAA